MRGAVYLLVLCVFFFFSSFFRFAFLLHLSLSYDVHTYLGFVVCLFPPARNLVLPYLFVFLTLFMINKSCLAGSERG